MPGVGGVWCYRRHSCDQRHCRRCGGRCDIHAAIGVPVSHVSCELGEPTSDVCDPGSDQVKSNMYSFIVVFTAQILALVLSKFVLVRKMNKMVDKNDQARRGLLAVFDTATLKKAEAFVEQANREDDEARQRHEQQLTAKQKMKRGGCECHPHDSSVGWRCV